MLVQEVSRGFWEMERTGRTWLATDQPLVGQEAGLLEIDVESHKAEVREQRADEGIV